MASQNKNQLSLMPPPTEGFQVPQDADPTVDERYDQRQISLENERDRRQTEASADMEAGLRVATDEDDEPTTEPKRRTVELPGRSKGRTNHGIPTRTEMLKGMSDAEIEEQQRVNEAGRKLATLVSLKTRMAAIENPEPDEPPRDRTNEANYITPQRRREILEQAIERGRNGEE